MSPWRSAPWLLLAAALTATSMAIASETVAQQLSCRGNEPFWRLDLGPDNALLRRLGAEPAAEVYRGTLTRFAFLEPEWRLWRGSAMAGDDRTLVIAMRAEPCLDSMADGPAAPYRAIISFADATAANGCCSAAPVLDARAAPLADLAAKPGGDWTRLLSELMPAVAACLIEGGVAVEGVMKAWPMNRGKASVRLAQRDGAQLDCIADLSRSQVDSLRPLLEDDPPLPGAGNPVLLPAREQLPAARCGRLERVIDSEGRLWAWLHYDPC